MGTGRIPPVAWLRCVKNGVVRGATSASPRRPAPKSRRPVMVVGRMLTRRPHPLHPELWHRVENVCYPFSERKLAEAAHLDRGDTIRRFLAGIGRPIPRTIQSLEAGVAVLEEEAVRRFGWHRPGRPSEKPPEQPAETAAEPGDGQEDADGSIKPPAPPGEPTQSGAAPSVEPITDADEPPALDPWPGADLPERPSMSTLSETPAQP
jgi:hypothetical protein